MGNRKIDSGNHGTADQHQSADQCAPHLLGIILAGGQSARMGENKAALVWAGQSLLDHARTLLRAAGCGHIEVSGRPDLPDGFADSQLNAGPAQALLDARDRLADRFDGLLAIPVDMPLLAPIDLMGLVLACQGRACAWQSHPLPLFLPASQADESRSATRSVHGLLADLAAIRPALPPAAEARFVNVNTPADFSALPRAGQSSGP